MPAKRPAQQQIQSPVARKKAKEAPIVSSQTSLASFFASPNKHKPQTQHSKGNDVITIDDSDDEDVMVVEGQGAVTDSDEVIARKLADEWAQQDQKDSVPNNSKGKERARDTITMDEEDKVRAAKSSTFQTDVDGRSGSKMKTPPRTTSELEVKPAFSPAKTGVSSIGGRSIDPIDFNSDPFVFDISAVDVHLWPKGRLPYSILAGVYAQVSGTRSRLAIVRILTNFLHLVLHTSPIDLPPSLYLLSNHLTPSYITCDLGVGSSILSKTIQEVSGLQPRDLKRLWQKYGDPGDVAFEAKSNLRTLITPAPLLVGDVYGKLLGLAKIKGPMSGKIKGDVVRKLMVQARGEEVRFLVRSMIGNLRIGAVRLTILTALARASTLFNLPPDIRSSIRPLPSMKPAEKNGKRMTKPKPEPDTARESAESLCLEAIRMVRKTYVRHPNYADLVTGLQSGTDSLEARVPVSVGIPLLPMLGSITRSLKEVFTRLESLPFTAEAKLDGQRVQIHTRLDGPQGEDDGGGRWYEGEDGANVWVRLFSRHLEDMTEKYPDVGQLVLSILSRPLPSDPSPFPSVSSTPSPKVLDLLQTRKISSLIIDAEIVAIDKETGAYRTFQDLSNRAKKDVKVEDIKVIVGVFAFDLMLLNDVTLLDDPFSHRRHLLRTLLPPYMPAPSASASAIARYNHVESIDSTSLTDSPSELQAFFEKVVEAKCEGLMVKLLETGEGLVGDDAEEEGDGGEEMGAAAKKSKDNGPNLSKRKPLPATYEPDQRSQGWLKVKKDYLEGLGDSLDLVPIGAWWGQGRKAGWWSPILLACHNPESGALEAVCKCISGFSDAFYKDLTKRYPAEGMPEKCNKSSPLGYVETNGLTPDVWFDPSEVWEIRGADITLSPVYPAASSQLGSERGLSVRFPRFIRIRDDKGWEEATTSEQFAEMYRRQMHEGAKKGDAGTREVEGELKEES